MLYDCSSRAGIHTEMSNDDKDSTFKAVPHVTDAYHKARRNLIIVSGILLAWEYVGVRVDKTTAEIPGTKTPVYLENPDVLPYVIFLLVLYFLVRLSVEWFQCDSARREQWPCQLDIFVALSLALAAIVLFTYHNILAGTHTISLKFRFTMILTAFLYTMAIAVIIRKFYRKNLKNASLYGAF